MDNSAGIPKSLLVLFDRFDRIPLEQLIGEQQMNRIDSKFPLHVSKLAGILSGLESYYKIVEVKNSVVSPYVSLYFDTPDHKFFNNHQNGIVKRAKVRYRSYPITGTTFLEVKRKQNKGRTIKERIISNDLSFPFEEEEMEFMARSLPKIDPAKLIPAVTVKYHRVAFISKGGKERFSLDFNVNAQYDEDHADFGAVVILEVKQDYKFSSPIFDQLHKARIRQTSMSKYCLSSSLLKPELKANLFKPTLRKLKKINNLKPSRNEN